MGSTLGLGLMALLVLVTIGALFAALRQPVSGDAEAAAPSDTTAGRPLPHWLRALIVLLLLAAAAVEVYGLRVSLAAYGDNPPPVADRLVIIGVVLFFAMVSYYLYLFTADRITDRTHPPPPPDTPTASRDELHAEVTRLTAEVESFRAKVEQLQQEVRASDQASERAS